MNNKIAMLLYQLTITTINYIYYKEKWPNSDWIKHLAAEINTLTDLYDMFTNYSSTPYNKLLPGEKLFKDSTLYLQMHLHWPEQF